MSAEIAELREGDPYFYKSPPECPACHVNGRIAVATGRAGDMLTCDAGHMWALRGADLWIARVDDETWAKIYRTFSNA